MPTERHKNGTLCPRPGHPSTLSRPLATLWLCFAFPKSIPTTNPASLTSSCLSTCYHRNTISSTMSATTNNSTIIELSECGPVVGGPRFRPTPPGPQLASAIMKPVTLIMETNFNVKATRHRTSPLGRRGGLLRKILPRRLHGLLKSWSCLLVLLLLLVAVIALTLSSHFRPEASARTYHFPSLKRVAQLAKPTGPQVLTAEEEQESLMPLPDIGFDYDLDLGTPFAKSVENRNLPAANFLLMSSANEALLRAAISRAEADHGLTPATFACLSEREQSALEHRRRLERTRDAVFNGLARLWNVMVDAQIELDGSSSEAVSLPSVLPAPVDFDAAYMEFLVVAQASPTGVYANDSAALDELERQEALLSELLHQLEQALTANKEILVSVYYQERRAFESQAASVCGKKSGATVKSNLITTTKVDCACLAVNLWPYIHQDEDKWSRIFATQG